MTPNGRITHRMNGRVRLRIPDRRRDSAYFARLKETLSRCDGVESVLVNPLTASALISGSAEADDIVVFAENSGLFRLEARGFVPFAERLSHQLHQVDDRVREATSGQLDLSSAAAIGLLGATLWQVSRRRVLPEAVTILWYAASLLANPPVWPASPALKASEHLDS
jgi:Heavy metal associated domain 2